MDIRPHHLLCMQKFTGHGYNADFTSHMNDIIVTLTEAPETSVTLTQGCDVLCKKCPHNDNGFCTSQDKVSSMDGSVLDICGLSYGQSASWAYLAAIARKHILRSSRSYSVCSGCQWFELCRNTEVIHG